MRDKVTILGTEYTIVEQTEEENPKLKDANGICEIYAKKIIMNKIKPDAMTYEKIDLLMDKSLRHEIIHAFFAESGLRCSSDYAENEELVDWIAIQFPKIAKVFETLGVLFEGDDNEHDI